MGFNKLCAEERGGHSNGPEQLATRSASITALMCSGSVGPKGPAVVKSYWEEVLHYSAATGRQIPEAAAGDTVSRVNVHIKPGCWM